MFNLLNRMNMKKILRFLFITSVTISAILFNSCKSDEDKASYGLSKVTTFPVLSLVDEGKIVVVSKGAQYTEPGYTAFVGENDITGSVVVGGSVNGNVEKMYVLTYTATNEEGYSVTKTRNVLVADTPNPTTDNLAGSYTSSITRVNNGVPGKRGPYTQSLTGLGHGLYYVQDLLGGWYWIGSNYGLGYAYDGVIYVNNSGAVSLKWANESAGWGDGAIFVDAAGNLYDAGSHTITFSTQMGSVNYMTFNVTLVKQ